MQPSREQRESEQRARCYLEGTVLLSTSAGAGAANVSERVRADRRDKLVAKVACYPEYDAVRPPKAGLDRILSATAGAINVTDRELLEHLEKKDNGNDGKIDEFGRARRATHVSGVVDTLSDVQLLVGQFREQARNRSAGCVPGTIPADVRKADDVHVRHACSPATQSARHIPIRESSHKRIAPAFARRSISAIDERAAQRVDVCAASCP